MTLSTTWRDFLDYLGALGPTDVMLNAGLSILLLFGAALASFGLSAALGAFWRRLANDEARRRPPRTVNIAARVAHGAIWLCAGAVALSVWGLDIWTWVRGPGAPLLSAALHIVVVLVVAVIAWEASILAVERGFYRAAARAPSLRRAAQLKSLAPMARGVIRTVIAVCAGMIIISQFGVQIAPLLAGAGVVGIAVGFGAQTLVKDYLTGFMLVLEDIASVGDIVRIGDSGGLVEAMTLRTIRLRDFDGTLHAIPYSEAQIVHNLTKTFSYYVFDLPISYDSDIDKALALMRTVGESLRAEPAYADKILDPIEVVGVDSLADSAVVLKARIKTAPIQQWNVGREYNRRIKLAFDEAGIEIYVPHLKLLLSDRALEAVMAS